MEDQASSSVNVLAHDVILCSTFNPEASIAAIGSSRGITVLKIPPSSEYKVLFTDESVGCVSQIYQYEDTPLFALVCDGSSARVDRAEVKKSVQHSGDNAKVVQSASEGESQGLGSRSSPMGRVSDTLNRNAEKSVPGVSSHSVNDDSPRTITSVRILRMYDALTRSIVADVQFRSAVLNVQCNQRRLTVALASAIQIFEMPALRRVSEIQTAKPRNDLGLLALSRVMLNSFGEWVSYLTFPQSERGAGDVAVLLITEVFGQRAQDSRSGATDDKIQSSSPPQGTSMAKSLAHATPPNRGCGISQLAVLSAHRRPIAALAMTPDGSRIAAASTHGTVIKVFSGLTPRLLHVLRRGTTAATLYSLRFNATGALLAAINSNGSLHVFRCSNDGHTEFPGRADEGSAAGLKPNQPALPAMNFYNAQMGQRSFAKLSLSCVPLRVQPPSASKSEAIAVSSAAAASVANSPQARSMASAVPWHVRNAQCALSDNGQLLSVVVPALKVLEKRAGAGPQLCAVDSGAALQQYVLASNSCSLVNTFAVQ